MNNASNAALQEPEAVVEGEPSDAEIEQLLNAPAIIEETVIQTSGEILPPEPAAVEIKVPEGAKVSYQDLGRQRAKEIAGLDEKIAESRSTLRDDLLKVIAGPVESHSTYLSGFTQEMAERESKGKDIRTLRNVKSQVNRVLTAFKANPISVRQALENKSERWDIILKKLPKRSAAGRPSAIPGTSGEPTAADGAESASNIETATDAGKMVESLSVIAKRLREVAKGKKAWFAEYLAVSVLEAMEMSREHFQKLYAAQGGSPVGDEAIAAFRKALELDRVIK